MISPHVAHVVFPSNHIEWGKDIKNDKAFIFDFWERKLTVTRLFQKRYLFNVRYNIHFMFLCCHAYTTTY